jgi:hypothetical protein
MTILLFRKGDKVPVKLDETVFESESLLQAYIHQNPEAVPLYEIKADVQLLVLAREFRTTSGPIDALAIDSEGDLYIVETKLLKNPDKRAVIAQALDYGAALWKHGQDSGEFRDILDRHARETWDMSLTEKLGEYFSIDEAETSRLLDITEENLDKGIMRFVVLMDRIDAPLKDLILYVNQNSQFDVYAVQLECYQYEENEIVIPRVYGAEVKKNLSVKGSSSSRRSWTEEETLEEARENLSPEAYAGFMSLYAFAKEGADRLSLGSGVNWGSFGPIYEDVCPRTVFTLRTNGKLSWNLGWFRSGRELAFKGLLFESVRQSFDLSDEDKNSFREFTPDEWVPHVGSIIEGLRHALRACRSPA